MADLHSLSDNRESLLRNNEKTESMLLGGYVIGSPQDARAETFIGMLTMLLCPYFRKFSLTFFLLLLTITIYFASVFYEATPGAFFEPSEKALDVFGSKNNQKMDEFYRWFTPIFLHSTIKHLVFNMIMVVLLVSRLEYTVGPLLTFFIYLLSGVGGNVMSGLVGSTPNSVGASTSIFGILGAMIGWILINWKALEGNPKRNIGILVIAIFIIFNLLLGGFDTTVDAWGHFGGVLTGLALAFAVLPHLLPMSPKERVFKLAGVAFSGGFLIGGIFLFYAIH